MNRGLCLSDFTYLTFTDFGLSDFNVILISEYLYTIWIVRKEVLFDGKTFDRTSLLLTFKQRLRNRIHADFRRLNRSSFIILWFNRQLAVNIIDGKLSLSFWGVYNNFAYCTIVLCHNDLFVVCSLYRQAIDPHDIKWTNL